MSRLRRRHPGAAAAQLAEQKARQEAWLAMPFMRFAPPEPLQPGLICGIALREPVGDCAYYPGEIKALDDRGIRLELVALDGCKWAIDDAWFPWTNVLGATVIGTLDEFPDGWGEALERAHDRHCLDCQRRAEAAAT